jgi:uncharacterized membrane protein YwaF
MDSHHWFKIVASSDFNYVVRVLIGNLFLTFGHQHLSSQLVSQEIYLFYLIHSVRLIECVMNFFIINQKLRGLNKDIICIVLNLVSWTVMSVGCSSKSSSELIW